VYARAGLGYRFPSSFELDVTLDLATGADDVLGAFNRNHAELRGGVARDVTAGVRVFGAVGAGVAEGFGTPDWRALVGVRLGPAPRKPERRPEPRPELPRDRDGDGLLDVADRCPAEPEDKDAFEDGDGCPDPDNDQDLVPDVADGAPNDPEDRDGFEDGDGVPDPDNDKDTIADTADRCPNEPEDADAFEDGDGCPDLDNDKDTVADTDDECPTAPGKPDNKGCPVTVRIDNQAGRILILKRVEFATDKDVILQRSFPILEEVAATLAANPQLKRVRIEGHTDTDGPDAYNLDLSRRRAKSVVKWLVDVAKVDAGRLEGFGCGETLPIASNQTVAGKQENRRVEFLIVDPAPPAADARDLSRCVPAN
jgi:outer membrane protein OmpA-like peptidoglycan-associated protein